MKTVTYNIPNISCGHCVYTIKMEVGDIVGVQSVEASANNKTATITFDDPASEEIIKELLTVINYPIEG